MDEHGYTDQCGQDFKEDGLCAIVGAWVADVVENPEDIERLLIEGLRKMVKSGEVHSTGFAIDMREVRWKIQRPGPAIKVILESKLGDPVFFYQPFRSRFLREPVFEECIKQRGTLVVFDDTLDVS